MTTLQNVMGSISASVDNYESKVVTARQPSSAYVTLSSRDRYFNASPTQTQAVFQPWNNFILQKAEALVPTYTKRLAITEVRFPWFIPNITRNNNLFGMIIDSATPKLLRIDFGIEGFYTPTLMAVKITELINAAAVAASVAAGDIPTLDYLSGQFSFVGGANNTPFAIVALKPSPSPLGGGFIQSQVITDSLTYLNAPNLLSTIGMPFEYLTINIVTPLIHTVILIGDYSLGLYTEYVDITSEKLMRFADARDAGSGSLLQTSAICRLYLADEVSLSTLDSEGNPVPAGSAPFVIHRQFKNPKQVLCSPDSFIGDLDIQVFDQFGKLVYVPKNFELNRVYSYPDFQITMLASEN